MQDETITPRWPIGTTGALLHALGLAIAQALLVFVLGMRIFGTIFLGEGAIFEARAGSFILLAVIGILDLVLVFWLGVFRLGRFRLSDVGWIQLNVKRDFAFGLLGAVVFVLVLFVVVELFFGQARELAASLIDFSAEQRLLFFLIGCLAATVEETIFRGYMHPTLQAKMGQSGGIICMAVIFAMYHLNVNPAGLLVKFSVGVALGILRNRSGGLWAPAIAHALFWIIAGSA